MYWAAMLGKEIGFSRGREKGDGDALFALWEANRPSP